MRPELVTALLELFAPKPVKDNCPIQEGETKMVKKYYDHDASLGRA
jgi:hypothetical protein